MSKREWCLKKLFALAVNPAFAAFITAVGVLAGFYGAVNGDLIKQELPTVTDHWIIIVFWIAVVVFSVGFSITPWAQAKLTEDAQNQLRQQSDKLLLGTENLEKAIRTLPPKGFLAEFTFLYEQAFLGFLEVSRSDKATKQDYESAIRIVLAAVASLAYFFDGKPLKHVYSANIMLARNPANLSADECRHLESKLKFHDKSLDVRRLEAILELCPQLSTSTSSENAEPDNGLPQLTLPVPNPYSTNINGKKLYNALPGAPVAYATGIPAGYRNTATLVKWCIENGNYSPSMNAELKAYFEQANDVVSFLSVPLNYKGQIIGILNLHANKEGILGDDGLQLFVPLLCPYSALLCMLIERWDAFKD